jgi:ribonuclease P protein component
MKIVSSLVEIDNPNNVNQIFLGFKITRKIAKAVIRNKIRRRIKSIIRNLIRDNHNISPSQAFIIIPRKLIIEKNYKDIEEEIKAAFQFLNKKLNQLNSIKLIDSVLN